ncbi:MAG: serine/threonine protein kinase [Alphaproteobacteria bacterium]
MLIAPTQMIDCPVSREIVMTTSGGLGASGNASPLTRCLRGAINVRGARVVGFDWRRNRLLKADFFSHVDLGQCPERWGDAFVVRRDVGVAVWWVKPLAHLMVRREVRALKRLNKLQFADAPQLLHWDGRNLCRSWHAGEALKTAQPRDPAYYGMALECLKRLHALGVAHNDLAKEANWLVTADGRPFLIDFQLAYISPRRGWLFRHMAREDVRHLLKHKRTYCPDSMTEQELRIVATPSLFSRVWRKTGKRVYNFVTRRIFRWQDAEGEGHYKRYEEFRRRKKIPPPQ